MKLGFIRMLCIIGQYQFYYDKSIKNKEGECAG